MDESEEMTKVAIKKCKEQGVENLFPVKGDLITGSAPETKFDLIFILLTLHHIEDVELLLRKFNASLMASGKLVIIDLEKEDGSFHDGPFHGHLGFGRTDLENMLSSAGFAPDHYEVCYNIEKETVDSTTLKHMNDKEYFVTSKNQTIVTILEESFTEMKNREAHYIMRTLKEDGESGGLGIHRDDFVARLMAVNSVKVR